MKKEALKEMFSSNIYQFECGDIESEDESNQSENENQTIEEEKENKNFQENNSDFDYNEEMDEQFDDDLLCQEYFDDIDQIEEENVQQENIDLNTALDNQEFSDNEEQKDRPSSQFVDMSFMNSNFYQKKEENNPLNLNYNRLINNYVYEDQVSSQKSNKFPNKKEYCKYNLRMHVEDYFSQLRKELNEYIYQQNNPQQLRDPQENQYDYLSFLDYRIKEVKFTQIGFTVFINVKRRREQVFKIKNDELESFKDESLIIFLNPKTEFLFTGTVASIDELVHYKLEYDEQSNEEIETIIKVMNKAEINKQKKQTKQGNTEEEKKNDSENEKDNPKSNKNKKNKKNKQNGGSSKEDGMQPERNQQKNLSENEIENGDISNQYYRFTVTLKIEINQDNAEQIIKELTQAGIGQQYQRRTNEQSLVAFEAMNYWLPFKYTYLSLKAMEDCETSFEEEIIKGQIKPNIYFFDKPIPESAPSDYTVSYPKYSFLPSDTTQIVKYFSNILERVDAIKQLDSTQNETLKYILTNPISLVQGPPGTGKTYISFEAIKILLETYSKQKRKTPILIICRRNETVNDYLARLKNLYEKNKKEKKEQQKKENDKKKGEQSLKNNQQNNKNMNIKNQKDKSIKQSGSQIQDINNQKSKNQQIQIDRVETMDDEWKKSNQGVKKSANVPFLRLGAGGNLDTEEYKNYLLPGALKFPEKIEIAKEANKNLLQLTMNQNIKKKELNFEKDWKKFEEKFNHDILCHLEDIKPVDFALWITNLFLNLYLSDCFGETRKLILTKKQEIFSLWLNLDLSSENLQKIINIGLAPFQTKQLDYHLREMKNSALEYEDVYGSESYQLILYQPILINQEGQQIENTQMSFLKYLKSFNKLNELTYFHIMAIQDYVRFYCKDSKLEKFISQNNSYNIQLKTHKEKLREKQLIYFQEKDVICKLFILQKHKSSKQILSLNIFIKDQFLLYEIYLQSIKDIIRKSMIIIYLHQIIFQIVFSIKLIEILFNLSKVMTLTQSHISGEVIRKLQPEIILIDEAAENHESEMAHLLSFQPKHLIQVGDHFQLKPIMQDETLKHIYKYGFSQFQRLFQLNIPHKQLIYQRRMTPPLSKFVRLFYSNDTYKDANEQVNLYHQRYDNYQLLQRLQQDVIFIPHTFQETKHKIYPYTVNYFEAFLCIKIIERLIINDRKRPEQITVLSMYKGQEYLIKEQLKFYVFDEQFSQKIKQVCVTTVDSYQGKENDIIIVSCVKSNENGSIGFLKQKNRINVAFSRARQTAFYICNLDFLAYRHFNTMWPQVKDLALNDKHIQVKYNYIQSSVQKFQRFWQHILKNKQVSKCMYCDQNCHIGLCQGDNEKNFYSVIQQFISAEERQEFYEYMASRIQDCQQNQQQQQE